MLRDWLLGNKTRRTLCSILIATAGISVFAGCGGDNPVKPKPYRIPEASVIVDENGGRVESDGYEINIPRGAVSGDVEFTIKNPTNVPPLPAGVKEVSNPVELESGEYDGLVDITLPVLGNPKDPFIAKYFPEDDEWFVMGGVLSSDRKSISGKANELSLWDVIDGWLSKDDPDLCDYGGVVIPNFNSEENINEVRQCAYKTLREKTKEFHVPGTYWEQVWEVNQPFVEAVVNSLNRLNNVMNDIGGLDDLITDVETLKELYEIYTEPVSDEIMYELTENNKSLFAEATSFGRLSKYLYQNIGELLTYIENNDIESQRQIIEKMNIHTSDFLVDDLYPGSKITFKPVNNYHREFFKNLRDILDADLELLNDMNEPEEPIEPVGEKIVYTRYREPNYQLVVRNHDGSGEIVLVDGEYTVRDPTISPDNKKVAFTSDRDGSWNVWIMEVTSGNLENITNDSYDEEDPDWSPRGDKIAYVYHAPDHSRHIYTIDLNSGIKTRISPNSPLNDMDPSWSPDGNLIALCSYTLYGNPRLNSIYVMNSDGSGGRRYLVGNGEEPNWISNDELVYTHNVFTGNNPYHVEESFIRTVDLNGNDSDFFRIPGRHLNDFTPSPDFTHAVFTYWSFDKLCIMDLFTMEYDFFDNGSKPDW